MGILSRAYETVYSRYMQWIESSFDTITNYGYECHRANAAKYANEAVEYIAIKAINSLVLQMKNHTGRKSKYNYYKKI